jgi:hypothetical protein
MPYKYLTDRVRGEEVLRRLCVGAQVDGIRFGPVPQLLITDHASKKTPVRGQIYLNLASRWSIFPSRPEILPLGEESLDEPEETEALRQLCEMREAVIVQAELGADAPDLLLTFEDGRVFFLNGRHEQYETWQFGIAFRSDAGALVGACPGNEVAVWELPQSESAARYNVRCSSRAIIGSSLRSHFMNSPAAELWRLGGATSLVCSAAQ